MQRKNAVQILMDHGPRGAQALLEAELGEQAKTCWLILGRLVPNQCDYRTEDDNWTVIALRLETIQPWSTEGVLGKMESDSSLKVDDVVSEPGYAHQDDSGLWVWFKDQKLASPNA